MTTTDANGIVYLQDTDDISPFHTLINVLQAATSNALDAKIRIARVANEAARNALTGMSVSTPIYADQADNGVLYRNNGTGWLRVAAAFSPHLRLRAATTVARGAAAWSQVTNLDTVGDTSGSAIYTVSAGGVVTITESGLYALDTTITMTGSTFATRIQVVAGAVVLTQTPVGSGVSFSSSISTMRRLSAGDQLIVLVYPTTALTVSADSATTPTFLSITKISN